MSEAALSPGARMLKRVDEAFFGFEKFLNLTAALVILGVMLVGVFQVVGRKLISLPVPGYVDIIEMVVKPPVAFEVIVEPPVAVEVVVEPPAEVQSPSLVPLRSATNACAAAQSACLCASTIKDAPVSSRTGFTCARRPAAARCASLLPLTTEQVGGEASPGKVSI